MTLFKLVLARPMFAIGTLLGGPMFNDTRHSFVRNVGDDFAMFVRKAMTLQRQLKIRERGDVVGGYNCCSSLVPFGLRLLHCAGLNNGVHHSPSTC